jgi:cellulose synthase/poly-beta-1,6-N-acetylglucosamine synthase-like glycosyltransferase
VAFLSILFWLSFFLILYTYIGYPILITVLAYFWKRQKPYFQTLPSVTFIIVAYNEEDYISKKIDNTLLLDYPREKLQILVVADGSTDQTPQLVNHYQNQGIELAYIPERYGKFAAMTRAVQFARGEIVVFSDANNMYDPQSIRELVLPFSDSKVGGTTGAKLIIEDGRDLSAAEGLYWKYESWIKIQESEIDSCISAVGEMITVRKSLFPASTEKVILDDQYLLLSILRQGYRMIYTPKARSFEYVSETAKDEVERRTRINAGLYQTMFMSNKMLPFNRPLLIWQIISHKYFRAIVPFAFIILLLSNILLVFRLPQPAYLGLNQNVSFIFLGLQIAFYAIALLGNFLKFNNKIGKILYLPSFLVNSNIAILMGFYKYITNQQSHSWKRVRR